MAGEKTKSRLAYEGYNALAKAVVTQAVEDYRFLLKSDAMWLKFGIEGNIYKHEIERFFNYRIGTRKPTPSGVGGSE